MRDISLIPFVCSAGGKVVGSERAALDLKESALAEHLIAAGLSAAWQIDPAEIYEMDFGRAAYDDLPPLGSKERDAIVLWHCRNIQDLVVKALSENKLPVTLGGDHSMAAGSISGAAQALGACGRTGVLWIDAHPDLNTPETSHSQTLHGMPVAALLGMGDNDYARLVGTPPPLKPEHLVYVGIRSIDPGEREFIDKLGITAFTMDDIARLGMDNVLQQAKAVITKDTDIQVLSIDLDGFDPTEAPATGSPVPDGLKQEYMLPALAKLASEIDFSLIEIAEYNPTLEGRDRTFSFIENLLKTLLVVVPLTLPLPVGERDKKD